MFVKLHFPPPVAKSFNANFSFPSSTTTFFSFNPCKAKSPEAPPPIIAKSKISIKLQYPIIKNLKSDFF